MVKEELKSHDDRISDKIKPLASEKSVIERLEEK